MKKIRLDAIVVWSVVGIVVLSVGMSAPARAADAPETIKFMLDVLIGGYHAPYFLAVERGFFAAEGLTVEFTEGRGATETVKIVAQGASPLGQADYTTMMTAIDKGLSVQGVFAIFRTNGMVILSLADQPIRAPRDLEGKVLAAAATSGPFQLLPVLLKADNADIKKITIHQMPPSSLVAAMIQHQCDALATVIGGPPVLIEQQGLSVYVLRYADFGVNPLLSGIVVNRDYLTGHEATVKGFLRALSKGWHAALAEPEAAVDALLKHYPDRQKQRAVYLEQLKRTIPLLQRPGTEGKPLGWTAREDWEDTQKLLLDAGMITQKLPLETYYTNDYLPTE